jgi:[protein-PII] uridylyltransferase
LLDLWEAQLGGSSNLTLVAVGGYGRGELSPHSDIDLLFLAGSKADTPAATLRGLLYPLWDAGFQVGHAVRTPKEADEHAATDLDAATSQLSARLIAGDPSLLEELTDRRSRWFHKHARPFFRRVTDARLERHRRVDRAGWMLAPDIKEDIGGLRDLHTVLWLRAALGGSAPEEVLLEAGDVLLAVREGLHAGSKRKLDRVRIDLQPWIASRLGIQEENGADFLMKEVHSAARAIEHLSNDAILRLSRSVLGGPKRSGTVTRFEGGVKVLDGELAAHPRSSTEAVSLAIEVAGAVARTGRPIAAGTLRWMRETFSPGPSVKWPAGARRAFLDLLRGKHNLTALELLDHIGALSALVEGWSEVRGRPQHDPYHRYTVDGHLLVTVTEVDRVLGSDEVARRAAEEAGDLDALRLAALLHDIGKGSGEDHSVAGERVAREACERMGCDEETTAQVGTLVRHHLLLPDTATRRDIDDGAVIDSVVRTIVDGRTLRLLYILAAADGLATGPEAWSEWKATLVRDLYRRALIAVETGELPARNDVATRAREIESYEPTLAGRVQSVLSSLPPSYLDSVPVPDMVDELRLLLQRPGPGEVRCRIEPSTEVGEVAVTVCALDRPGTLARTAGVLALHRVSVRRAQAYSTDDGIALERFLVHPEAEPAWDRFVTDLEAAYSGRLALDARLERKIADYRPARSVDADVRVLADASETSTVIEVRAPDTLGLLYAITSAISALDLDINVAKIDTLGERIVDAFYVRTSWGSTLDEDQSREVDRAILHRIDKLF